MLPSSVGVPFSEGDVAVGKAITLSAVGSATASKGRTHRAQNCWKWRSHPRKQKGVGCVMAVAPTSPGFFFCPLRWPVGFPPRVASAQKCVDSLHFLRNRGQTLLSIQGPLHLAQDSLTSGMKHTFPILSLNAPLCQAGSNQATFFN